MATEQLIIDTRGPNLTTMPNQGRRYYTNADRALLWSRSGGICCYPDCNVQCVQEAGNGDPSAIVGQIAHIEANSDAGPRANPSLSQEERSAYANLILLCPTHHSVVDARESTYTVNVLRDWKSDRERKFQEALAQLITTISFAELETVTNALMNQGNPRYDSITVIPPREKMARNGLTDRTVQLFNIGLVQTRQVEEFVKGMSSLDSSFVGRLTSGFVNEYQKRKDDGLDGDALFEAMRLFSAQGNLDISYQSAGLAVLVYLFERCEVFEQ